LEKAWRESVNFSHATMHMFGIDESLVALIPMRPVAWNIPRIGTEQIVRVDRAAVKGIDICSVGPTH
jgi:hypothetical protein